MCFSDTVKVSYADPFFHVASYPFFYLGFLEDLDIDNQILLSNH